MTIANILSAESLQPGIEKFRELVETGSARADLSFKHKNGSIRWWSLVSAKISDTNFLGFTKDITEQKIAVEKLAQSEEQYRNLFESVVEGVMIIAPDGMIKHANRAAEKILGLSLSKIKEMPFPSPKWELMSTDRLPLLPEEIAGVRAMKEKIQVRDAVMGVRRPDRFVAWINVNAIPLLTPAGDLKHVIITFSDITMRTNAEEALFANESRLKKTQEIAHLGTWEFDQIKRQLIWSDEVFNIFGLSPQTIIPTYDGFMNMVHPDDAEMVNNAYLTAVRNGQKGYQIEHRIIRKPTNQVKYVFEKCENVLDESGRVVKSMGMIHDITERKEAEAALRQSEELFRSLVYNSSDLMILTDALGRISFVSPQCHSVTGHPGEKITGHIMPEIVHPEDVERAKLAWDKVLNGRKLNEFEYRIIDDSGKTRWVSHTAIMIKVDEKIMGMQSILRNITKRKVAEQALKVSEEKYRTMLNASPDGIFIIDLKGIITDVSVIGMEMYGSRNAAEMIGKHFLRFIPREEKEIIRALIEKTMLEGIAQNIEIRIKKKNLSFFLSETSATLIQGPDGSPFSFMIILRDISQRKKIEKKQIHADRMANLGEMASGIAHEINQPLNTISVVLDNILFESARSDNFDRKYLNKKADKIFENIIRIRNIIDHVRSFSRSQDDFILTGFDINTCIDNTISMISEQFKHQAIHLDLQKGEKLPPIIGNTFKLEQVILNLLSNAKDALFEKRKMIASDFIMTVCIRSFAENQNVIVEISDNGTGIMEEDLEYIMLPFYTTKDAGKGTGLGLSISYQILQEMNGTMEILNNPDAGTTFKLILATQNNHPNGHAKQN